MTIYCKFTECIWHNTEVDECDKQDVHIDDYGFCENCEVKRNELDSTGEGSC